MRHIVLSLSPAENKHVEVDTHLFQTVARLVYHLYWQHDIKKKKSRKQCFGARGR